jgi:probable phosphoglycerate mutase
MHGTDNDPRSTRVDLTDEPNADVVTTVLMIRHADVHNPENIVYGRLPRFGLSAVGWDQVERVARLVGELHRPVIYSSPRLRARQTARILAASLGQPTIKISKNIDEVLTRYQGQPNSVLSGKMNFYDTPAHPDDETIAMVARRMTRFLQHARTRHPGQLVLGISHADPIMILRTAVLGLPLVHKSLQGRYYPAKVSITQFSFVADQEKPVVVYRELIKDETLKRSQAAAKPSPNGRVT